MVLGCCVCELVFRVFGGLLIVLLVFFSSSHVFVIGCLLCYVVGFCLFVFLLLVVISRLDGLFVLGDLGWLPVVACVIWLLVLVL